MASPFWNFSVAVYSSGAVQDECLTLQDQFGLDVNLVLLCAFAGAVHGTALTPDDIASARALVGPWHKEVVSSLRTAHRRLKTIETPGADATKAAADLRTQVKATELESERIEQMILEQWASARLDARPQGNPRETVPANLQALLAGYGIGSERLTAAQAMPHLIAAALARI
jgi:uncharacterized protein (TIGR02444 family)